MVCGAAMGMIDVPWQAYFFVVPVGSMITAIPISPAGVGVGQAAFDALFNLYLGYNSHLGASVVTVQQMMMLLFGLIGAYFYVRRKKVEPFPMQASQQAEAQS
jgi:uncharacterized membrane protein YbhN (UPF0104 family)